MYVSVCVFVKGRVWMERQTERTKDAHTIFENKKKLRSKHERKHTHTHTQDSVLGKST